MRKLVILLALAAGTTAFGRGGQPILGGNVEATCTGRYDAVVLSSSGFGMPFLVIYDYSGDVVHAAPATRDIDSDGRIVMVKYSTGSVLRGGASLRIRAFDQRMPELSGAGHLTFNRSNSLVDCRFGYVGRIVH